MSDTWWQSEVEKEKKNPLTLRDANPHSMPIKYVTSKRRDIAIGQGKSKRYHGDGVSKVDTNTRDGLASAPVKMRSMSDKLVRDYRQSRVVFDGNYVADPSIQWGPCSHWKPGLAYAFAYNARKEAKPRKNSPFKRAKRETVIVRK
jgi:hypothetical protein